ncbi:MAG TPA: GNAT family N-acetyltransferase [Microlunatus sp.]|nr:GNAT family N-acetyltransferase [Microlunatus sp.]
MIAADVLIGETAVLATLPDLPDGDIRFGTLHPDQAAELARLYLEAAHPPGAPANLAQAQTEVAGTFAGEFGQLWADASATAYDDETLIGSIQVVKRSPWDPELTAPFIIDFFVAPTHRSRGVGRALLARAARVCLDAGHQHLALRTGDGTSPTAHRLYQAAGMQPPPPRSRNIEAS